MENKKDWKTIRKPRVFINKDPGFLCIIYQNRTETYEFKSSSSYNHKQFAKENDTEINIYTEIELCKNSGMKEVHYATEEEVEDAWDNIHSKED